MQGEQFQRLLRATRLRAKLFQAIEGRQPGDVKKSATNKTSEAEGETEEIASA